MTPQEYEALVRAEMIRRGISAPEATNMGYNAQAMGYPQPAPSGMDQLMGPLAQAGIQKGVSSLLSPSASAATQAGEAANAAFGGSAAISQAQAANEAWNAAGSAATEAAAPGMGFAPYAGLAGAGLGAYGLYNSINSNDKKGGALSGMALGGGLAAAAPLIGLGPIGWGGLALAAALGGGAGFGLTSALGHKSTKQYQQERTEKLLGSMKGHEDIVSALRGAAHNGADDAEWKRTATERMKDPTGMWGTYGMLNTFGSDYFDKMNEHQRYAITKAAIDNNLLKGNKGDIVVTDAEKLKALLPEATANKDYLAGYNAWKSGIPIKSNIPSAQFPKGGSVGTSGGVSPSSGSSSSRSKTLSPGIGLDGKRISY